MTLPALPGGHLHLHETMTRANARWAMPAVLFCAAFAEPQAAWALQASAEASEPVCSSARIGNVFVDNHTVFELDRVSPGEGDGWTAFIDKARTIASRMHWRTRRSFLENELLFAAGDCLDPLLLDESGRILRALPFITDADVYAVPVAADEVHVVVDTQDDWTLKIDLRGDFDQGPRLTYAGFTEENLFGTGTLLGFYLRERDETRDLGLELSTLQLAGTRLDGRIGGGRTRTGVFFHESLTYPFVGEVGRWAFIESYSYREDLFRYAAPLGSPFTNVSLPIQTRRAATTLGLRLGTPGDLTVLGAGVSWEDVTFSGFPQDVTVVKDFDFSNPVPADSATVEMVRSQVNPRRAAHVNIVAGKRNIRYIRRRGLDAVRGDQDVTLGTQAVVSLGSSLGAFETSPGNRSHELRGRLSLFGGAAGDSWVFNSELNVEGARLVNGNRSDRGFRDVVAEFGAYFYWQPGRRATGPDDVTNAVSTVPRHTLVMGVKGAGGWNSFLPFQLNLGGPFGIRGYDRAEFPAAQKLVAHLEDRIMLDGPFSDLFDLGLTLFADAGAGWQGTVPFAADSELQGAVGVGLRFVFPAGSRQVTRLDLAVPMKQGGLRALQFRVGFSAVSLLAGFGDEQVRRSRSGSQAATLFGGRFNR